MGQNAAPSALWQRALPLVLLTLGVLELGAAVFTTVRVMDVPAVVASAGPGGLVPVTLAVVFATLLRADRRALPVKGVTAAGAAFFALARIVLVATVASATPGLAIAQVLTLVSGTVMGVVLAGWAAVEYRTSLAAVRDASTPVPRPESSTTAAPVSPTRPPASATSAGALHPVSAASAGVQGPSRELAARPHAPVPRSAATPVVVSRPGQNAHNATALAWRRGSTPWPRKNEDDPDGTVIRPPRRR